jgi:outer membrane receptor for monomeric catechols
MSKTDTQTTQAEAVVTPDDAIKGAFAEVIAGEQQAKAKLRVTQAKIAEYEAPLVDIRKMVATAEANVIQAEKLGDTMKKVRVHRQAGCGTGEAGPRGCTVGAPRRLSGLPFH